jgi:hypothetical protein
MSLGYYLLFAIFALALALGIAMSRHPDPPPRRPNVSRPVPRRSVPPSSPLLAVRSSQRTPSCSRATGCTASSMTTRSRPSFSASAT